MRAVGNSSKLPASQLTNNILHNLYSTQYLVTHTIAGRNERESEKFLHGTSAQLGYTVQFKLDVVGKIQ